MEKLYDDAIERLSKDKDYIASQMDLLGFNQFEVEFINMVKDGIASQEMNGKLAYNIIMNMNTKSEWLATE